MVSIPDQKDMNLRIKQLTGGGSEESSDDSGDKNQSVWDFLQKKEFDKPLSNTLTSIISEIWEEPPPKNIFLKKLDTYEVPNNSKVQ